MATIHHDHELVHAEVWLLDGPADSIEQVRETATRVGLRLVDDIDPEPVDTENGIWNLPVTPVVAHRLDEGQDLEYRLADSVIVIPAP
jgi:hypothetical protein